MSIDLSNQSFGDDQNLSLSKRALIALEEMDRHLQTIKDAASEPIAVTGIGCRFPGDVTSPGEFWKFLCESRDGISEIPPERWDWRECYDSNAQQAGKMNARWGGFISSVDRFDADFFGISPREANNLDPQQRLVLETAWEALEETGLPPERLRGSQTGVFIGIYNSDYLCLQHQQPAIIDLHTGTGTVHALAANRLSYFLDLRGPSLTIDTSCSSSLTAIHLAVQSLRLKESDLALAGGVNLILSPTSSLATAKLVTMAADGRCKTFDKRADGIVRGEGCGIVVLKRLSDARRDGDRIWAVIRGSAVNQDGKSNGLTAPNGAAQEAVIRQALANAQVTAAEIGYVEAHGTGTPLGDPIEVEALVAVLGDKNADSNSCYVGSVKTNIGHLEAAAGIAGFIKTVLALKHRMIPPQIHFVEPNPEFQLEGTRLNIADQLRRWENGKSPRVAGVSAFSIGGTNAHIILAEAPVIESTETHEFAQFDSVLDDNSPADKKAYSLVLSARNQTSLNRTAVEYGKLLTGLIDESKHDSTNSRSNEKKLGDLCYAAATQRTHHEYRKAFVSSSLEELSTQIETFTARPVEQNSLPVHHSEDGIVLVFPGQGSQWAGMGLSLFKHEPVFREKVTEAANLIREYLGIDLLSELETGNRLHETEIAQPAIWAVETGIAAVLENAEINISGVIGHSVGEVAAAQVAGILTLEEAARVICARARLMRQIEGNGGMLALGLNLREAEKLADIYDLDVAACNSIRNIVLSGNIDAVTAAEREILQRGEWCRRLAVRGAFHSRYVRTLENQLRSALHGLSHRSPQIPFYSTVISGAVFREQTLNEDYWIDNLCQSVLFQQAVTAAFEQGHRTFVEAGAQKVLQTDIRLTAKDLGGDAKVVSLQQSQGSNHQALWQGLGQLYENGFDFNWSSILPQGRRIELPLYQWQRQRYWIKSPTNEISKNTLTRENTLLAEKTADSQAIERLSTALPLFQSRLSAQTDTLLNKHQLNGMAVLSVGHYLSFLLEALENIWTETPFVIENLRLLKMLHLPQSGDREIQIAVLPSEHEADLQFFAKEEANQEIRSGWTLHVAAKAKKSLSPRAERELKLLSLLKQLTKKEFSTPQKTDSSGNSNLKTEEVWRGRDEMLVNFRWHQEFPLSSASPGRFLPELILSSLEFLPNLLSSEEREAENLPIPISIGEFFLKTPPTGSIWMHLQKSSISENPEEHSVEIAYFDDEGRLFGEIKNLTLKYINQIGEPETEEKFDLKNLIYVNKWIKQPLITDNVSSEPKTENTGAETYATAETKERTEIIVQKNLISELSQYQILLPYLEGLSGSFVLEAFKRLGWRWQSDDVFKLSSIITTLKIKEEHIRLLSRFLQILTEIGLIEAIGYHEWTVKRLPTEEESQSCNDQQIWADLFERFSSYEVEIELLKHCGENLADVLTGRREALELLFTDSKSRAFDLYNQSPVARYLNRQAAQAVRLFVEDFQNSRKPERKLRILEIGGGTGATTVSVLPIVAASCSEYLFTDISPSLLRKATSRFKEFDFFQTKVFDVENSPFTQNFDSERFDLIIAANVLHATTDLHQNIGNVRELLSEDAALLLIEGTSAHRWVDLTFGLTTGWWRFTDDRAHVTDQWGNFAGHPLISAQEWKQLLQNNGFAEAFVLNSSTNSFYDSETPAVGHSVILAGQKTIGKALDKSSDFENAWSEPAQASDNSDKIKSSKNSNLIETEILPISSRQSWLIFGKANCRLTQSIVALLSSRRIACRLVLPDENDESSSNDFAYPPVETSIFNIERIKIEESQSYRDVVQRWSASSVSSGLPETGVVLWLWSAAADGDLASASVSAESAAAAQWQASLAQCRRLLFLMQALAEVDLTTGAAANVPRLWVITAGAQPVGGGAFDIAQSPTVPGEIDAMPETGQLPAASAAGVWGMGRVFSREHPSLWGGSIDLEPYRAIRHKAVQSSPGTGGAEVVEAATARAAALELYREIRNACRGLEKDGTSGGGGSSSGISSSSESLIEEASEGGREEQIGYRRGERFVARLERVEEEVSASLRLRERAVRSDGWYLISGGLGGLGLAVGEWLLEQGAGRVVLASRGSGSEFEEEEEAESRRSGGRDEEWRIKVEELERRFGTERVAARRMDVSDWRQVRKLIEEEDGREEPGQRGQARNEQRERERERAQEGKPKERLRLRGVIQSAGEVSDAVLERQDEEKFERAMRAKVAGGWNLHYATLSEELDFFILFSSAVTMLGMTGLGSYTAANSLLDGLAHYRRSIGLTALAIDWSGWEGVGMAQSVGYQRELQWNSQGLYALNPKHALEAFGHLFKRDVDQAAVMRVDWHKFCERLNPSQKLYFSDVIKQKQPGSESNFDLASSDLVNRLNLPSENSRLEILRTEVQKTAALVLGRDPQHFFDADRPLSELGLDSLMSVELRNLLAKSTGLVLPATLLFEAPTTEAIATYLLKALDLPENESDFQLSAGDEADAALLLEILDEIEGLSEGEIRAELDRLATASKLNTEIKE